MRIDAGRSIGLALFLAVMWAGAAAAEPQIVWQVENPFRFFLDPADTQVHRATWLSLSDSERNHPVQSAERDGRAGHPAIRGRIVVGHRRLGANTASCRTAPMLDLVLCRNSAELLTLHASSRN